MKTILIVGLFIIVQNLLLGQGQCLNTGENGVTLGLLTNDVQPIGAIEGYGSIAGAALFSYYGIVDINISSGITTNGSRTIGHVLSPGISFYFLRGEESRIFLALHASYTKESVSLNPTDNDAEGGTYGIIFGGLVKKSHEFTTLPSLGIYYQHSSQTSIEKHWEWYEIRIKHDKYKSITVQSDLSFYVPTSDHFTFVPGIACGYNFGLNGQRAFMLGIYLTYLYSWGE